MTKLRSQEVRILARQPTPGQAGPSRYLLACALNICIEVIVGRHCSKCSTNIYSCNPHDSCRQQHSPLGSAQVRLCWSSGSFPSSRPTSISWKLEFRSRFLSHFDKNLSRPQTSLCCSFLFCNLMIKQLCSTVEKFKEKQICEKAL